MSDTNNSAPPTDSFEHAAERGQAAAISEPAGYENVTKPRQRALTQKRQAEMAGPAINGGHAEMSDAALIEFAEAERDAGVPDVRTAEAAAEARQRLSADGEPNGKQPSPDGSDAEYATENPTRS